MTLINPYGRYELRGDGVSTTHRWGRIPSVAAPPSVPSPPPLT